MPKFESKMNKWIIWLILWTWIFWWTYIASKTEKWKEIKAKLEEEWKKVRSKLDQFFIDWYNEMIKYFSRKK